MRPTFHGGKLLGSFLSFSSFRGGREATELVRLFFHSCMTMYT